VVGTASTYVYDGDGKRSSATSGGSTTSFVYDVGSGLPVVLLDANRKYVWGAGGLAYETDLSGNVQSIPLFDGLGSVRALTDGTGVLVQTYRTDPFGVPTTTQGASTQPFRFTGELSDPTGLVYLRARMYDPQSGRFVQRDPLAKSGSGITGWNRYVYAGDNPLRLVDPSGLNPNQARVLSGSGSNDDNRNCLDPTEGFQLQCFFPQFGPGPGGTLSANAGGLKNFDPFGKDGEGGGAGGSGSGRRTITVTQEDLEHVLARHTPGGSDVSAAKSVFTAGEDIAALIRGAEGSPAVKQADGPNYETVVNAGRTIGIDRATGEQTSIYTVITRLDDSLVTMFPGRP